MIQLGKRRLPYGAFALALPLFLADMAPPFGCGACGGSSDRPPHETDTGGATDAADTTADSDDSVAVTATGTDSGPTSDGAEVTE